MGVDREAVRVWLEASCALQGVSVIVSDPGVVAQVGILLGVRDAAGRPPGGGDRSVRTSQAPGGPDPARINGDTPVARAGGDGAVIEHGGDDCRLAGEV